MSNSRKQKRKSAREQPTASGAILKESPSLAGELPSVGVVPGGPGGLAAAWRSPLVKLALVVAVGWWLVLIALAVFTANPVVLNRTQIAQSDVVVTATIPQADRSLAVVEKVWSGEMKEKEITVINLRETNAVKAGRSFVMPLTLLHGEYRITTPLLPRQDQPPPPVIYPATPAAIAQLEQVLQEIRRP